MRLKLGETSVEEYIFNDAVLENVNNDNAVVDILNFFGLTCEDVQPIEIQYIKARLFDAKRYLNS